MLRRAEMRQASCPICLMGLSTIPRELFARHLAQLIFGGGVVPKL